MTKPNVYNTLTVKVGKNVKVRITRIDYDEDKFYYDDIPTKVEWVRIIRSVK